MRIPDYPRHQSGMRRDPVLPGQESVWDYPRPPKLESSARHVEVRFAGETIADTHSAYRVLETSHPPSWYIPPSDIRKEFLQPESKGSHCEWKGAAHYWSISVGNQTLQNVAWSYPRPTAPFAAIANYVALYPGTLECFVDGERVKAQPGGFYGGWITKDVAGPFKGAPGTWGW